MIKVDNLSYSFPQKDLFKNISFTLEDGKHCAFIGVSGSGKSTLAQIIMHPDDYLFEGHLELEPNCHIGYVTQFTDAEKTESLTVFEYVASECLKRKNEVDLLCEELATATEFDVLLEKYQEALDAFEAVGGEDFESIVNKKLNLANLSKQKEMMISELSGGEFKLVQIIKEMLNQPDLLIMDEPDVFLDFEHINALKELINSHKGTLLVITHNRYLLNHCFNKILHLENMALQEFDGNYIDYNFSLLERKIELQELAHDDTEEIKRNAEIINRLRTAATNNADASRGRALKARVKLQERLVARRIQAPFVAIKQPTIHLHTAHEIEETTALTVTDFSVSFDDALLENVNFEIGSKDKVALIGANGTGKTTLLRAIFKNAHESIKVNEDIQMAYLSQLQGEVLNEAHTIREAFMAHGFETIDEITSYLANYAFSPEAIYQRIGNLSGGEKNILQLALMASGGTNMLLLDEPTSHLDTYAQLALEEAIKNYNGAILMVSHDFYTIANCMDYVLIIEDHTIRKMSIRKFRKMIYARHFDKDYLELEQKKKALEMKVAFALKEGDFTLAKKHCDALAELIDAL